MTGLPLVEACWGYLADRGNRDRRHGEPSGNIVVVPVIGIPHLPRSRPALSREAVDKHRGHRHDHTGNRDQAHARHLLPLALTALLVLEPAAARAGVISSDLGYRHRSHPVWTPQVVPRTFDYSVTRVNPFMRGLY